MSAQTTGVVPVPVIPVMQKMKTMFGKVLKGLKTSVMVLVLLIGLWVVYTIGSKAYLKYMAPSKAEAPKASFAPEDVISFTPTLGKVIDVSSDRTADALLSGTFGPAVVLFGAEWCAHCRNMEPSFQAAAKASNVPFVKVDGSSAPVTSTKFTVTGYPTVFGISSLGLLSRYGNARTTEGLLEFSNLLMGEAKQVAPQQQSTQVPLQPYQPQVQQNLNHTHRGVDLGVPLVPHATVTQGPMVSSLPSALDTVQVSGQPL